MQCRADAHRIPSSLPLSLLQTYPSPPFHSPRTPSVLAASVDVGDGDVQGVVADAAEAGARVDDT